MSKIKVDYINRIPIEEKMTGIKRHTYEIQRRLEPYVDAKDVCYKSVSVRMPHWAQGGVHKLFYSIQKVQHRVGSIKHIEGQDQAYILNYINLSKVVVVCHDLIPYIFPYHGLENKLNISFSLKGMLKADRLIVNSNFTKHEILKYLTYPAEKITVIHRGVDANVFKPMPRSGNFSQKYGITAETKRILYIGNNDPRRNLLSLIEAFYKVKKRINNAKLFIAGEDILDRFPPMIRQDFNLDNKIQQLNLQKDVVLLGYVEDGYLPQLYNEGDVFVFSSSYEGFGIPLLEAMACGVPVITSNTSSLPEVVGEAGIMVNPNNVDDLTNAMQELLTNEKLREDLIKRGLERAKRFTWERAANQVLGVYKDLLKG